MKTIDETCANLPQLETVTVGFSDLEDLRQYVHPSDPRLKCLESREYLRYAVRAERTSDQNGYWIACTGAEVSWEGS